jgi:N6-adenosine-specific RNA methylase IME4
MYDVIVADPPWRYNFSVDNADKIERHYATMTVEDICNLQVPSNNNAVLYLWATAPKLKEALKVMEAWGFEYKTNAVWDKTWIGMGYWFRGQHELLLVGVKGKFSPPIASERVSSVIVEKKGKHSQKPTCILDWIDQWFPTANKLEMFARRSRDGWDSHGEEIEGGIVI